VTWRRLARSAGSPRRRQLFPITRNGRGLLFLSSILLAGEHLDGAVAAVDPDPVAAVHEHGGVAASDDGGDAEFAGYDRGVGERRADVGDDGGGAGKTGVQPTLVTVVTRISPSPMWAASSGVRSTRAMPSTTPAAPGNPVIVPAGSAGLAGLAVWARPS
jgi:hypothetical protein